MMLIAIKLQLLLLLASLSLAIANTGAGDSREYIIWANKDIDLVTISEITAIIQNAAGQGSRVYKSLLPNGKPRYWLAELPGTAVEFIKIRRGVYVVSIITPSNCAKLTKYDQVLDVQLNARVAKPFATTFVNSTPTGPSSLWTYATQTAAPSELRVISQPVEGPNIDIKQYQNYVYRVDTARMTYIYHAELGIDARHADFQGRPIEWLYTGLAEFRGLDTRGEAPADPAKPGIIGHSTCTASKAAGRIFGAAKQATLVVVKMPDLTIASLSEVLPLIEQDIQAKRRARRSFVSISWGSIDPVAFPLAGDDILWNELHEDMARLMESAVIVCAAGNDATGFIRRHRRKMVDTAPAAFTFPPYRTALGEQSRLLVVVGNSDNRGKRHSSSQQLRTGVYPQIYAPGVNVQCAAFDSPTGSIHDTGTSFCKYRP